MLHLLRELFRFGIAVFGHWQTWLSGGGIGGAIVLIVTIFERLIGRGLSKRTYVYIFLVAFFLGSCFLAWVDGDDTQQQLITEKTAIRTADIQALQGSQNAYGELKWKCAYQSGVVDTLGRQNRDQQNSINSCFTQAIHRLTPVTEHTTPLFWDETSQGTIYTKTMILLTNVDVPNPHIEGICGKQIISAKTSPVGVNDFVGSATVTNNGLRIMIAYSSPTWGPRQPLRLTYSYRSNRGGTYGNDSADCVYKVEGL